MVVKSAHIKSYKGNNINNLFVNTRKIDAYLSENLLGSELL
jgi:hypothetical protein